MRVHADGTQAPLWSTTSDDREEHMIVSAAQHITVTLVLLGVGLACFVSCSSQLKSVAAVGSRDADEERERLQAE